MASAGSRCSWTKERAESGGPATQRNGWLLNCAWGVCISRRAAPLTKPQPVCAQAWAPGSLARVCRPHRCWAGSHAPLPRFPGKAVMEPKSIQRETQDSTENGNGWGKFADLANKNGPNAKAGLVVYLELPFQLSVYCLSCEYTFSTCSVIKVGFLRVFPR